MLFVAVVYDTRYKHVKFMTQGISMSNFGSGYGMERTKRMR